MCVYVCITLRTVYTYTRGANRKEREKKNVKSCVHAYTGTSLNSIVA